MEQLLEIDRSGTLQPYIRSQICNTRYAYLGQKVKAEGDGEGYVSVVVVVDMDRSVCVSRD